MRVIFFLYFHFARQAFDVFDQQCIEIWDFFFKMLLILLIYSLCVSMESRVQLQESFLSFRDVCSGM